MLENIKAGNYNNYIGNNASNLGHNISIMSQASHDRTHSPPIKENNDIEDKPYDDLPGTA